MFQYSAFYLSRKWWRHTLTHKPETDTRLIEHSRTLQTPGTFQSLILMSIPIYNTHGYIHIPYPYTILMSIHIPGDVPGYTGSPRRGLQLFSASNNFSCAGILYFPARIPHIFIYSILIVLPYSRHTHIPSIIPRRYYLVQQSESSTRVVLMFTRMIVLVS